MSDLSLRSKAHWGYGEALLEACRSALTLTEVLLQIEHVVVAERDGDLFHAEHGRLLRRYTP